MPNRSGSLSRESMYVLSAETDISRTVATRLKHDLDVATYEEDVDPDDLIERKALTGIIVGEAPGPQGSETVHDNLLRSGSIRCLLACPSAFVLLVTSQSREQWNRMLGDWYAVATRDRSTLPESALSGPLRAAVFTSDDSDVQQFVHVQKRLQLSVSSARFDPSGLRSTIQFLVKLSRDTNDGELPEEENLPPRYALIADDERLVAESHAYLLRRKGYSVLTVHEHERLKDIESELFYGDSEFLPDVILMDQKLEFGSFEIGSVWMKEYRGDELRRERDVVVSGKVEDATTGHIPKPLLDVYHLDHRLKLSPPQNPRSKQRQNRIPNVEFPKLKKVPHTARQLREVSFALNRRAHEWSDLDQSITAMICWWECFGLSRGCDGGLAAQAYMYIHMEEAKALFDTYLEDWEAIWRARLNSIDASVLDAFANEQDPEQCWWRMRVYNALLEESGGTTLPRASRIDTEILLLKAKAEHLRQKYKTNRKPKNSARDEGQAKTSESDQNEVPPHETPNDLSPIERLKVILTNGKDRIDVSLASGLKWLSRTPSRVKYWWNRLGLFLRINTLRFISNWTYVVGAYAIVLFAFTFIYLLFDRLISPDSAASTPILNAFFASLFASPEEYDILNSHQVIQDILKYIQGVLYAATFGLAFGYFFERFLKRS